MKQTLFMIAVTAAGVLGTVAIEPFVGVAVYYFFGVLRPQFLWIWALPQDIAWSQYVAVATMLATGWTVLSTPLPTSGTSAPPRRFSFAHQTFFLFSAWILASYFFAQNRDAAWPWLLEYLKVFVMFGVASLATRTVRQVWCIYLVSTCALIYIAYEMNYLYFSAGRVDIYNHGYGGLDNNGAGLMLAMGVPLAIYAWEASTRVWRWAIIAGVPLLLHAVLMSYSRGAMLSLIVATPLIVLRSRRRFQLSLAVLLLLCAVPIMAGKEIRARFFSTAEYNTDDSANSRFESWRAAFKIANDYPLFGVGIRNSPLMSYAYGADKEGRVIHSQYLQTLADSGYPGLALYLIAVGSTWFAILRTRRVLKRRDDTDARLARSMLSGLEGSLLVFCFGGAFLSLEVFELPYVIMLCAVQTSLLMRIRPTTTTSDAVAVTVPANVHALWPRASQQHV